MTRRTAPRVEVSFAYRVRAFHDRVVEVREDELFSDPDAYHLRYRLQWVEKPYELPPEPSEYEFRVVSPLQPLGWSRTRLRELTTLIRPFLGQESDELASINQMRGYFRRACTDPGLRDEMNSITRARSLVDTYGFASYDGGDDARSYTHRTMADAVLYGDLIHVKAGKRILLEELRSEGADWFAIEALVQLFHETGAVAIRIDDLLERATAMQALSR